MQFNKLLIRRGARWNLTAAAVLVLSACGGSGGGGSGTSTPTPGSLQLESTSYTAAEGTATVTVSVTRSGGGDGAVSVDYATADGTADSGDYTSASGTLNWADGDSTSKTVDITIVDDSDVDPAEAFSIALSNVMTASLGANTTASVNITDDEIPGSIQMSATSYNVTEGTATVTVSVTRTGGSDGAVSVDYATADSTADSGDYTSASGTLNWSVGDTAAKTVDITITDDATVEFSEALTVTLSNATVASLGTDTAATVSIADNDSITVTGTVSAPNGTVAFNGPTFTDHLLAMMFGNSVYAAIGDFASAVGAGVTVNVYEVDETGALVSGTPITTATTDSSGAYVLAAPLDAPASKYIIRADGTSGSIESRITATTVDVDPVTDATSVLVAYAASDLADINVDEIVQIQEEVSDLVEEIDAASLSTATALSGGLEAAAKADEEINNVVTSTAAPGTICGTVTKQTGTVALANINVVAKDFGNWVTRAKAKTASDGTYCMNVPFGDYIVAAINRTGDTNDADRSASEWYNGSGGGAFPVNGDMVSVPNATQVDVDFDLDPGIRIHGTVSGSGGTEDGFMEGVQVQIRDVETNFPVAAARVKADGTYRVNVRPGKYTVQARNLSQKPYASQYATTGANAANNHNLCYARVYDLSATTPPSGQTIDFTLSPGYQLSGSITEGGNPVTGTLVMVDDPTLGCVNARLRSNIDGQFRIWLKPGSYDVIAYGQTDLGVDMSAGDYTVSGFTVDVDKQPILVQDSGSNPVSQAKVLIYDSADNFLGRQVTSSDGTATMYSATNDAAHKLVVIIDSAENHGSTVYDTETQQQLATAVPMDPTNPAANGTITVNLPDAGTLLVEVTSDGSTAAPNVPVQVRDGGNASTNKFVSNRTRADGKVVFSLPGANGSSRLYDRVRINGTGGGNCDSVPIQNGLTTTITFDTSNTGACVVGTPQ